MRPLLALLVFLTVSFTSAAADPMPSLVSTWGGFGGGDGQLNYPFGIAIDEGDVIYVADQHNNRIQKFDTSGNFLGAWGSDVLFHPTGIDIGADGLVYVTDHQNHRVAVFTRDGVFVRAIGTGALAYPVAIDCEPSGTFWVTALYGVRQFTPQGVQIAFISAVNPYGVTSTGGYLFVSDCDTGRIYKYLISTKSLVQSWGVSEGLYCPEGSIVDSDGNLWICDTQNDRVVKYTQDGIFLGSFPVPSSGGRPIPPDIAIEGAGHFYVTAWGAHEILKFSLPGGTLDCSSAFSSPSSLWPPDRGMSQVSIDGIVDPEGGPVLITITSITQDEPVESGGFCPDAQILADGTALLRRERQTNGRVYRVSFTASAQSGASCNGVVTVCVPPSRGKLCVEDPQVYDSLGSCPSGSVFTTGIGQIDQRGPSISVAYSTSQPGEVRMELFDVTGRRVGILVNQSQSAGVHSAGWNVWNLSTGLYFFRLRTKDFEDARRVFIR